MHLKDLPSHGDMICIGHGVSPHGIPTFPLVIIRDDVSRAKPGLSTAIGVVSAAESVIAKTKTLPAPCQADLGMPCPCFMP